MTIPFDNFRNEFFGGTEYMARGVTKNIIPNLPKFNDYRCLVIPGEPPQNYNELYDGKPTILWIHNTLSQFDPSVINTIKDERFNLKYIIAVSEWQKQGLIEDTGVDPNKIYVIQNAIDPVKYDKDKYNKVDKVKIIHASSPDRGMDILLAATQKIDEDFELNIFNNFYPDNIPLTEYGKKILDDPRINFYGKTPRKTVLKFFGDSHIHAYPTVWAETSCLVQMEALSSNCLSVFTDIAALEETSLGYGIMTDAKQDEDEYVEAYAKVLSDAIKQVKNKQFDPKDQAQVVSDFYSWEKAKERWTEFHELL